MDASELSTIGGESTRPAGWRRPSALPVAALLAAVVFGIFTVWLSWSWWQARSDDASQGRQRAEHQTERTLQALKQLPADSDDLLAGVRGVVLETRENLHGYTLVLSADGTVLHHPIKESAMMRKTVDDLAQRHVLWQTLRASMRDYSPGGTTRESVSDLTGRPVWVHVHRMEDPGWWVATVYPRVCPENVHLLRRLMTHAVSAGVLSILFAIVFIALRGERPREGVMWTASTACAIVLLAGTSFLWMQALAFAPETEGDALPITTPKQLDQLIASEHRESIEGLFERPIVIPTGMFILSLDFASDGTMLISGYVWQYYSGDIASDIDRGVIFPDAQDVTMGSDPDYVRPREDGQVLGWHFKMVARQVFNNTRFPFDWETVSIRMWHQDFDRNVILIPDIDAYDLIAPQTLPGLESGLQVRGWHATSTYFSIPRSDHNANFGIPGYVGQLEFPDLKFNIVLKRNFIDPFTIYITPIIVVLILLFALQMTITRNDQKISLLGFNAAGILASTSALFFVVLFSHAAVRTNLGGQKIVYLEYFYTVGYLTIMAVSVNTILFALDAPLRWVCYRDNLAAKMLFWPVTALLLFLATLYVFY